MWLWAMAMGCKVGVFLSDIQGAFDRVDTEVLLRKCQGAGLCDLLLSLLRDFFAERQAVVLVNGKTSTPMSIMDQVFQGTVLGPPMWNLFFADSSLPVMQAGGSDAKFADDLTCYHVFTAEMSTEDILGRLQDCQALVHSWGVENMVAFDPSKEAFLIYHKSTPYGETTRLLGALLDNKLIMEEDVDRICNKIRPKVKALLRTRAFYCTRDMLTQYKTHIWPHLENTIGAYFHAANSHLLKLDGVQIGYLHSLGLDAAVAFSEFNFTSTRLRRCIGTLGLLHKCTLGLENGGISQFFQPTASSDT